MSKTNGNTTPINLSELGLQFNRKTRSYHKRVTMTATTFESGQRVFVMTYDGREVPGTHTVAADQRGLDHARWVRVKTVVGGETRHDDVPTGRVRARR